MCPIEFDIDVVDEAVDELENSIEIWRNETTACFPGQLGLVHHLPVYRVEAQTLSAARELCEQRNSEILTIENLQQYEQLFFILKQRGIFGFMTSLKVTHDTISFWPGEKDFKNWMPKEDIKVNIEKVLPKFYIGDPVNREAIFVYEDITAAKRTCQKMGGSFIQFTTLEEFEAINRLALKSNLTSYSVWLDWHSKSKTLNWPSGKIFYFNTLEKTIGINKETEEKFKGYVSINLERPTPRLIVRDDYDDVPFLCELPHLVDHEVFYLSLLEFGNPSYCIEKLYEPFGAETPILCLQKPTKLTEKMQEFNKVIKTKLIEYTEKEPAIQDLASDLKAVMKNNENITDENSCWPHLIQPIKKLDFLHPMCQASEQSLYQNKRIWVRYLAQIQNFELSLTSAIQKIEKNTYVHLEIFSSGSFSAFFSNFGRNTRTIYLVTYLIMFFVGTTTTLLYVCRKIWKPCKKCWRIRIRKFRDAIEHLESDVEIDDATNEDSERSRSQALVPYTGRRAPPIPRQYRQLELNDFT